MTPKSLVAPARLAGRPLLATQTDERLVDLVRAGNETAFEVIVNRYRRGLLRYVARLLSDGRAEDVVQQVFVNAYWALRSNDTKLRLRPWLYRIAHNMALNALPDRGRLAEELHDDIDGVEPPDQILERRQGLRDALAAVKSLPDRQRSALILREMEGRSYDEIAAELGATGGAVRQLLSRARQAVRAGLTSITPPALLGRIPWGVGTEPVATRVAELCGAGAAGAAVAKVCAGALVTSAVVSGVAVVPNPPSDPHREASASPLVAAPPTAGREVSAASGRGGDGSAGDLGNHREPRGGGGDDRNGPGDGEDSRRSGEDETDSSGPGSGHGHSGSSGSGSSGSGSSGSGSSGSGSSGSGSSGSGSSGSGSSGSGSSGSGSSGSGSSGSGSSGSGSSGSGSSGLDSSGSGSGSSASGSGSSGSGSGSSGSGPSGSSGPSSEPTISTAGSSDSGGDESVPDVDGGGVSGSSG